MTAPALPPFWLTSVFLSDYLEARDHSQTHFRKTVTLSMDLRAVNLLVAAMTVYRINLIKQILVPTWQLCVLANN